MVGNLTGELMGTLRAIDPEGDEPAAWAAAAAAVWLAAHPGQVDKGDHVIREGVRLVLKGDPPEALRDWLAVRGVDL
jgi:hypothetical protein